MHTLHATASEIHDPSDYTCRPSGHPVETFDDGISYADVASIDHQVSLDLGDDAASTDAACAEIAILARHPNAVGVSVTRCQSRRRIGNVVTFSVKWDVFVALTADHYATAEHADVDVAVSMVLAKLSSPLAA